MLHTTLRRHRDDTTKCTDENHAQTLHQDNGQMVIDGSAKQFLLNNNKGSQKIAGQMEGCTTTENLTNKVGEGHCDQRLSFPSNPSNQRDGGTKDIVEDVYFLNKKNLARLNKESTAE